MNRGEDSVLFKSPTPPLSLTISLVQFTAGLCKVVCPRVAPASYQETASAEGSVCPILDVCSWVSTLRLLGQLLAPDELLKILQRSDDVSSQWSLG